MAREAREVFAVWTRDLRAAMPSRRAVVAMAALVLGAAGGGGAKAGGVEAAGGAGAAGGVAGAGAAGQATAGRRAFTIRDSIGIASFVNWGLADELLPRVDPIVSPDRQAFLLITERGRLESNQIESTLWLFDRQAVADYVLHRSARTARRPAPRALATLAATSNLPVISGVRWLDGGRVAFLGKNGSPYQQLFIADLKTGDLAAMTPKDAYVSGYDVRGDTIAYTTIITRAPALAAAGAAAPGHPATGAAAPAQAAANAAAPGHPAANAAAPGHPATGAAAPAQAAEGAAAPEPTGAAALEGATAPAATAMAGAGTSPAAAEDEMVIIGDKTVNSLLHPNPVALEDIDDGSIGEFPLALHLQRRGQELPLAFSLRGKPLELVPGAGSHAPFLAISPDENALITWAPLPAVPPGWDAYPPKEHMGIPRLVPGDPRAVADDNYYRPLQFVRIDLRTGEARPLVDAPVGLSFGYFAPTRAYWFADSRHALLSDTFLPLPAAGDPDREQRIGHPVIGVVDVATGALASTMPIVEATLRDEKRYYINEVVWDAARQEMTLRYVTPPKTPAAAPAPETLAWRGGEWLELRAATASSRRGMKGAASPADAVQLSVEEAFDKPPVLAGRRRGESGPVTVWDPNPQLAGLALGKVSLYRWQDKHGVEWSGLLALPPDYDAHRRYPLVIQTHGIRLDKFFADGTFTTGSGGRALAAKGVVILQMDMPTTHLYAAADAPLQLDGFQAVVARLAADGVIDPRRVGVIGFSWTCYHTLYALANDPELFAAAAITDGYELSYSQYILDESTAQEMFEEVNGGKPWGAGLVNWAARSPTFNLDKVKAPLLVTALGRFSLMSGWEPYAGLHRLGKPVEMQWLRRENATHVLTRPSQRYLSQQSAVDWFDFWLNGREDPAPADPARSERFARWRELRKLQQAAARPAAAPGGGGSPAHD